MLKHTAEVENEKGKGAGAGGVEGTDEGTDRGAAGTRVVAARAQRARRAWTEEAVLLQPRDLVPALRGWGLMPIWAEETWTVQAREEIWHGRELVNQNGF